MPGESRLRENRTSGSEGRAEVADRGSAASPDPTVQIGVHNNAPGAKDPRFDRAGRGGKR